MDAEQILVEEKIWKPHCKGGWRYTVKVIAFCEMYSITELSGITCHMVSLSLTCHLSQVNTSHLNPSQ